MFAKTLDQILQLAMDGEISAALEQLDILEKDCLKNDKKEIGVIDKVDRIGETRIDILLLPEAPNSMLMNSLEKLIHSISTPDKRKIDFAVYALDQAKKRFLRDEAING